MLEAWLVFCSLSSSTISASLTAGPAGSGPKGSNQMFERKLAYFLTLKINNFLCSSIVCLCVKFSSKKIHDGLKKNYGSVKTLQYRVRRVVYIRYLPQCGTCRCKSKNRANSSCESDHKCPANNSCCANLILNASCVMISNGVDILVIDSQRIIL
jgi:hypothetical protein